LKITIHRGGRQIGGCITEIETNEDHRIFIDLGENLSSNNEEGTEDPWKAKVNALKANAVFYTHHHGDHVGLSSYVDDNVPQYISEGGKRVLVEIQKHIPNGNPAIFERLNSFEPNTTFTLDGVPEIEMITPIRVSHSAFESCMFYIRVNGVNILHTGDFRLHGIQDTDILEDIKKLAKDVDILIVEGTMLNRNEYDGKESKVPWDEQSLCDVTKKLLSKKPKYPQFKFVYAISSSTDPERLWSFYSANHAIKYGEEHCRLFVVDKYQWDMFRAFSQLSEELEVPYKFDGEEIREFKYDDTVLLEDMERRGALILLRANKWEFSKANFILNRFRKQKSLCLYSAWIGYLSERFQSLNRTGNWTSYDENYTPHENLIRLFGSHYIPRKPLHTGGHARRDDILAMCKAVNPSTAIIPIHKDASADFLSLDGLGVLKERVFQPDKDFGDIQIEVK